MSTLIDTLSPITLGDQLFSMTGFIYLLDFVGIVACAIAGTILAKHKHFDIFGCILVSMVGAIGGGTVRDVLLDRHPLFWTLDLNYVIVITLTSLICQIFFRVSHHFESPLKLFDAIGLAAFSVIGLTVALSRGATPAIAVMMAVITSIAGGIMRDMICNRLPLVLQKEIYISASIIGCLVYFGLIKLGMERWASEFAMLTTVFAIRMLALHFDLHLPNLDYTTHIRAKSERTRRPTLNDHTD